jgi:hypothetical protein
MRAKPVIALAALLTMLAFIAYSLPRPTRAESPPAGAGSAARAIANPKSLSPSTTKGLAYLVSQQHADGGWGQGGGWRRNTQGGRIEGAGVTDPSDLGNTCVAALTLIRAGNTPHQGQHATELAKAFDFICRSVENSSADDLYVTDVRDTQLQQKIGPYVDTFVAGLVLSELKDKVPAGDSRRLLAALNKIVAKIEKNQQADGTFAGNGGWAPVLSLGLCSKFLNRAAQQKVAVKDEVLKRDYAQSVAALDRKTGDFKAAKSPELPAVGLRIAGSPPAAADAGVMLYGAATGASRINDFGLTVRARERAARETLADRAAKPADKERAGRELREIEEVKSAQEAATSGIVRRLDDQQFLAGFGNNGGEEFLSYMNISEMLCAQGGDEWRHWDQSITRNLERIQNQDGSWSGQHCITGRTFCTATALLTLMADRAPVQMAATEKPAHEGTR